MRRAVLSLFFVAYFAMWLAGGLGSHPIRFIPEWLLFFTRSACLFPGAATESVDYYAEGWDCGRGRWVEIDHRPYFPIIISGRETRFDRIVHLFRYNQKVLADLRVFLVQRWNLDHLDQPIADVRLLSLRTPVPPPGGTIVPYERKALDSAPSSKHKLWSKPVPLAVRQQRCQAAATGMSLDLHEPGGEQ